MDATNLSPRELADALRAQAKGGYAEEAAVDLLIAHGYWLRNSYLRQYVDYETDPAAHGGPPMAAVRWQDAIAALDAGKLPCSTSEGQIFRIAASLGGWIPVNLRDAISGLDHVNIRLVAEAILRANGREGYTVTVPKPPLYPPGVRVVEAGTGRVLQEGDQSAGTLTVPGGVSEGEQ
ncbi:hypothetical protein LI90_4385 (plasmid) [Carbonactinospora thermoautotrophica]|uniref:Uncharacterized protein n=1 Tax=Carbonactinospora thermoautotrophica TaxID=1469144 RepID=A0A132MHZ0_9ACTN|nr:hypothetical protein [Carbonactinospora thermoautotrophica]KWW97413.1 hypothetical protein LI90_4385 [Carbonactinospora thermoautotrophica]